MEHVFLEILKGFGPTAAAIAFFVWRDAKREDRMLKSMDETQMWIRNTLVSIVKENTESIREVMTVIQNCGLRERHCDEAKHRQHS